MIPNIKGKIAKSQNATLTVDRPIGLFKFCLFSLLVGEVVSKYKTKLILSERQYQTVLDCGTNAYITIHNAIGGYVVRQGSCAEDTDQQNWISCAEEQCQSDDLSGFER